MAGRRQQELHICFLPLSQPSLYQPSLWCLYCTWVSEYSPFLSRFLFHNGTNETGSLSEGYWRMDIYLNETYFLRDRPNPNIYDMFAVPKGASYACSGNTSLNTYSHDYNDTVSGPEDDSNPTIRSIHLLGIQVRWALVSQCWWLWLHVALYPGLLTRAERLYRLCD